MKIEKQNSYQDAMCKSYGHNLDKTVHNINTELKTTSQMQTEVPKLTLMAKFAALASP